MALLTDVFPPRSGGSGWSAFYLGVALVERGHSVRVVRPDWDGGAGPGLTAGEYEGLPVEWVRVPAAPRWAKQAGLATAWREREATRLLAQRATRLAVAGQAEILHGQHKTSACAASIAARRARKQRARVASVATVRDYWPLCPTSTRLFKRADGTSYECRECHRFREYLRCAAGGKVSPVKWPFAVARWLATWRASRLLAACDATIGVSRYVRDELAGSGRVPGHRLASLPNLVHLAGVERALSGAWPLDDIAPHERFALFVGKLDTNKGASYLPEVMARAALDMPLVLAGDGPLRGELETAAASGGLDFRFRDWLDNDAVLRIMRSATLLLFPSAWQEPLSRVLLEGCAASAAIVAMNTGGTGDIIRHMESGWLADDPAGLAEGARAVVSDPDLGARLRAGARRRAETVFSSERVAAEIERLYERALAGAQPGRPRAEGQA